MSSITFTAYKTERQMQDFYSRKMDKFPELRDQTTDQLLDDLVSEGRSRSVFKF